MQLKVCNAGATGRVGRPLCAAASGADDPSLVGAVPRTHRGRSLGDAVGVSNLDLAVGGKTGGASRS